MKTLVKLFTAFAVIATLAGCARTAPVDNIQSTVGTGHTAKQVRDAILTAGAQRKWIMNDAGTNVIRARQQSRDHVAEVRINYTATGYSINYESSSNLLASGGKIHKNYNRWVRNLDKDIQVSLASSTLH